MKKTLPLVLIEWEDITTYEGWKSPDRDFPLLKVITVGFLFKRDRHCYHVTPTVSDNGNIADPWIIPRKAVTKYQVLRKGVRLP